MPTNWYYAEDHERHGPVERRQIVDLVRSGRLDGDALVWKSGMEQWTPVREALPDASPEPLSRLPQDEGEAENVEAESSEETESSAGRDRAIPSPEPASAKGTPDAEAGTQTRKTSGTEGRGGAEAGDDAPPNVGAFFAAMVKLKAWVRESDHRTLTWIAIGGAVLLATILIRVDWNALSHPAQYDVPTLEGDRTADIYDTFGPPDYTERFGEEDQFLEHEYWFSDDHKWTFITVDDEVFTVMARRDLETRAAARSHYQSLEEHFRSMLDIGSFEGPERSTYNGEPALSWRRRGGGEAIFLVGHGSRVSVMRINELDE